MADLTQAYTALRNADKAGDVDAARKLASYIQSQQSAPAPSTDKAGQIPGQLMQSGYKPVPEQPVYKGEPSTTLGDKLRGAGETALALGTGALATPINVLGSIGQQALSGDFSPAAGRAAEQRAAEGKYAPSYQPTSPTGQRYTEAVGKALEPLQAVPFPEGTALARTLREPVRAATGIPLHGTAQGPNIIERLKLSTGKAAQQAAEEIQAQTGGTIEQAARRAEQEATRMGTSISATKAREQAATTASQQAQREAGLAGRQLPGSKLQQVGGELTVVPQAESAIGDKIRTAAQSEFDRLSKIRSDEAKPAFDKIFTDAEAKGNDLTTTPKFQGLLAYINEQLGNTTDAKLISQLTDMRNSLTQGDRGQIAAGLGAAAAKAEGGFPALKMQSAEILRRKWYDQASGITAEGYDNVARRHFSEAARMLADAESEYVPQARKATDLYRKLSEPLDVYKTKLGKSFGEIEPGATQSDFYRTPAQSIAKNAFKSPETFKILSESLPGGLRQARSLAREYFATSLSTMTKSQEVRSFIQKNSDMLKRTGALKMADELANRIKRAESRAEEQKAVASITGKQREVLEKGAVSAQEQATQMRNLSTQFKSLPVQDAMSRARSAIVKAHNQGLMKDAEFEHFSRQINAAEDLYAKTKDAQTFRKRLMFIILGGGVLDYAYRRALFDSVRNSMK